MNDRTDQNEFGTELIRGILRFIVLTVLFIHSAIAQITREDAVIRLGRYQTAVANDGGLSSVTSPGWSLHPGEGFFEKGIDPLTYLSIDYSVCTNWKDPDGKVWPYMIVSPWQEGNSNILSPVKLSDGKYMHNYVRHAQTGVSVNGKPTSSADPRGELNPAAINAQNTTADQFIESSALTNVGLRFTRRIYAWSHVQDNNYIIVEYLIKNVGTGWGPSQRVKLNPATFRFAIDTVQIPQQTIHGFIFGLQRIRSVTYLGGPKRLNEKCWFRHYGFRQGDTLRVLMTYDGQIVDYSYDSIGEPLMGQGGRLQNYMSHFVQLLHSDKSWDDKSDDITQPHYTTYAPSWNDGTPKIWGDAKTDLMYRWLTDPATIGGPVYSGPDILPILHEVNMDERGKYAPVNIPLYYQWATSHVGPYEIPPGQELRVVFAIGIAGLSPEAAFNIGRDWYKGTCTFTGKRASPLQRPPQASDNDWAKDGWVFSQIDSVHSTAARAAWNMAHNFQIPVPPPPLASLTIQEQVGGVKLSWSKNAESYPTFEGYRVYRAMGASDTTIYRPIAELSKSKGNLKTEYIDKDLDRGPDYYYYVTTFSISSGPNAYRKGEILESGANYVEAFAPSRFVPKEGLPGGHWQDSVRVVPNPFNLSARAIQFSATPDKMMFVNLPPVCTIRIYSENGTLIKTIEHTDGKSDEQWEAGGQYMLTDSGQRVVSGIYIAHFQTPSGESQFRKFAIVR